MVKQAVSARLQGEEMNDRIGKAVRELTGEELIAEIPKLSDRALGGLWELCICVGVSERSTGEDRELANKIELAIIQHFKKEVESAAS